MPQVDLHRMLWECVRLGVPEAWNSLIAAIQPIVRSAVLHALIRFGAVGPTLAEDLTQDVLLKLCARDFAVLRVCRAETTAAFHVYIRSIAATGVLDHIRLETSLKKGSGKATVNLDDAAASLVSSDSPAETAERQILLARIERCLTDKGQANRSIFWLYHRQGYTPKAIAALPGICLGPDGIETLVYRLTKSVRECLRKSGFLNAREGDHR